MERNEKQPDEARKLKHNRNYFGRYLFFIVIGLFAIFIGRFFYIGIFHRSAGENLTKKAEQLYASKTEIKAKRGTIYDAQNQPIAEDNTTYSVYIVLSKTAVDFGKKEYLQSSQRNKAARVLSKYLPISRKKVLRLISQSGDKVYQVELGSAGKNISLETKKKIEAADISGIKFTPSQARLYPNGIFASHLIGIAKNVNGNLKGVTGLEASYNKLLTGKNGISKSATDTQGVQVSGMTKKKARPAKNGDNIYTTLDPQLQTYLETLMSRSQSEFQPANMNAILMDAKTGKILAASQRPTYNAQTQEGMNKMWRNTLLEDTYEPGSTMKAFTVAASINSGHFNPNGYFNSGTYNFSGSSVTDWNPSGWGMISYKDAFYRSSNVGMAHLEQQMGSKTWLKYIKRFGFLKPTGIGIGDEAQGSIQYKYPIDSANTAYGQGINVTAMQMIQAYSAIANNGEMLKPRLVDKIVNPNTGKTVYQSHKEVVGHPIKSSTSKKVLQLMQGVVYNKNGTGSAYRIKGQRIAVKTGTAQIANPNGGGYMSGDTNYVFSVAGIAPANNPRYILYVTIKQPKTFAGKTEGQMTATIFNPLMKQALEEEKAKAGSTSQTIEMPNEVGANAEQVRSTLTRMGLQVTIVGNGTKIKKQSVAKGVALITGSRVILLTGGKQSMPDVNGWSRNDLLSLQQMINKNIEIEGSGYAYYQSVGANTSLSKVKTIKVKLK